MGEPISSPISEKNANTAYFDDFPVLHVCVTSRAGAIDDQAKNILTDAAYFMGKKAVAWNVVGDKRISIGRTTCILRAYEYEAKARGHEIPLVRGLLMDDDQPILNTPEELAAILLEADKRKLNITANYPMGDGQNLIFKSETERYTHADLRRLYQTDDFVPLHFDIGSAGFYYGDLPKMYKWHEDWYADDATYFFRENRYLNVHLATKIKLAHRITWLRSTWVNYEKSDI